MAFDNVSFCFTLFLEFDNVFPSFNFDSSRCIVQPRPISIVERESFSFFNDLDFFFYILSSESCMYNFSPLKGHELIHLHFWEQLSHAFIEIFCFICQVYMTIFFKRE